MMSLYQSRMDLTVPSANSRSTLSRQWELLKLLPTHSTGVSAGQLQEQLKAAGYSVTKRTVERDLNELSLLFPLQCNDKGTPYGWFWQPGKTAELPGITLSEALTLRLVEDSLRPLIPSWMLKTLEPRFNLAQQRLDAMSAENPSARWPEKVASVQPELTHIAPEVDAKVLELIQQALMNEVQLDCSYYSAHKNQHHSFILNPLGLVQRAHTTYLIATVEPYEDVRQFVLHRFEHVHLLDAPCHQPESFSLSSYISSGAMQFGQQGQIKLEAWVTEQLSRLLQETPIASDMQLTEDEDGALLTATVNDSWELKWWILSHAGAIQIRQPTHLKEQIRERLKAACEMQEVS